MQPSQSKRPVHGGYPTPTHARDMRLVHRPFLDEAVRFDVYPGPRKSYPWFAQDDRTAVKEKFDPWRATS